MMSLSNRAVPVAKKELTFSERLYFPAILKGMLITLSHLFKRKATVKYPDQERELSPVYRGQHVLKRDDAGAERCTACGLCAVACPAEAITMESAERKKGEESLYREEKYAAKYEINMLRCIFCGLCEEACPKDAIYLSETFAPSNFTRKGFVYSKEELLIPNPKTDKEKYEQAKGLRAAQTKNN
jgi:NADH-quinone oxidoreductase subunit I